MPKPNVLALTILGGLLSATLVLLPMAFPFLVFLSYFVPLPLFLLGLGVGLRPLIGGGLLATAILYPFEGLLLTTEFFFLSFLGSAFLVQRALIHKKNVSRETFWYSPSFLLRDLTLLSGIVLIFTLGIYLYLTQGVDIHVLSKNITNLFDPHGHIKDAETLLTKIFPLLPGLFTFSWMLMILFNAALAQGFLARIKANLRPTPSFKTIQIPSSFLFVFGLSLVLSFVGVGTLELLGKNAAVILTFPFFLGGLGIVHFLFQKTAFAKIGLIAFYCFLLFFLWPALFVIFLGVIKPWIEKPVMTN